MRYGMVIHPLLRLFTMARYINPLYNESLMDWWSPRHGYVIHLFTIAHMHWQPLGIKIDTPLAWLVAGGTGSSASTIFEWQNDVVCGPKESPIASSNHETISTKRGGQQMSAERAWQWFAAATYTNFMDATRTSAKDRVAPNTPGTLGG